MAAVLNTRIDSRSDTLSPRIPAGLAIVFSVAYAAFSLRRHANFQTSGFDLGIFEQAVRGYAHGELPVSDILGHNLLGEHFSPILAILAPFYRLFPSAETLLIAQALLLGLSVFPVTRTAIRLLGPMLGTTIGFCYGISWGLHSALAFDFHEVAFAVPITAFALDAYLRGKLGQAVAIAASLVLVKEDLGLTVAMLGLLIAVKPATRRLGLITAACGLTATLVSIFVLIPHFRGTSYRFFEAAGSGTGDWFDSDKIVLVLLVLAPSLFLALRSPLLLLVLPTLAWRLLSSNLFYWQPDFHYDAVLMPIVFFALVHSLTLLRLRRFSTAIAAALVIAGTVLTTSTRSSVVENTDANRAAIAEPARRLLQLIPDGASVAIENDLAPQLTSRADVHLVGSGRPAEWTLVYRHRTVPLGQFIASAGPFVLIRN
ncbi:putative membrane protein [Herbihabitans rhizosphaerae]|uniref:Putative membrane protein n=1 Tax=Herbihabitans rhizosphaerae TaxID=1872711 RepID=A0A4Q7L8W6_9PSEU|nr:DUF2079 domain-containing protein [Herbihabitans rhizosphaerae]RZS45111.1 putative membrane protein [Herbihabitans rhizosphaerae]